MESSRIANSYSRPCFLRAVFIRTAHTVFFSHLSKCIQALRNISHLYGLVKSLVPRGTTHMHTPCGLRLNSPKTLPF